MPEIPYRGVTGNDVSDEHLRSHGLTLDDANDVWTGPAKYFPQPSRPRFDELGNEGVQPERVKMVGPDLRGRLLTFILEVPSHDQLSYVVTGWISTPGEQTRYHQPGGRMRIR